MCVVDFEKIKNRDGFRFKFISETEYKYSLNLWISKMILPGKEDIQFLFIDIKLSLSTKFKQQAEHLLILTLNIKKHLSIKFLKYQAEHLLISERRKIDYVLYLNVINIYQKKTLM